MASQEVTFSLGTVPAGFCHTSWQNTFQTLVDNLTGALNLSTSTVIRSVTAPTSDESSSTWVHLNSDGSLEGVYTYAFGGWVRPHPVDPGDYERRFFVGTVNHIATKDGGVAGTATVTSGPFWEEDTEMRGRFPLGVPAGDTMPVSNTQITLGDKKGHENVLLIKENVPDHIHTGFTAANCSHDAGSYASSLESSLLVSTPVSTDPLHTNNCAIKDAKIGSTVNPTPTAVDNMPPYYAAYWIKRTARQYYWIAST